MMRLIKFLLVVVPYLVILSVIGGFSYLAFSTEPQLFSMEQIVALALMAVAGFSFLVFFIPFSYILDEDAFKKLKRYRFLLFLLMIAGIGYLFVDIDPQRQQYSIADLKSEVSKDGRESFLSNSFFGSTVRKPSWTEEVKENKLLLQDIEKMEEQIRASWRQIRPQRIVLEQLAAMDNFPQPGVGEFLRNGELKDISWLLDICSVYQGQILLSSRLGYLEEALDHLAVIQKVTRKGFLGSPLLYNKMVWAEMYNTNLATAYQLVAEYELKGDDLNQILALFEPVSKEEMSLYTSWVGEYLVVKSKADKAKEFITNRLPRLDFVPAELKLNETVYPYLAEGLYQLFFRKNMTDKLVNDIYLPLISDARANGVVSTKTRARVSAHARKPTVRNLGGWYLFRPSEDMDYGDGVVEIKVRSDLFAIFLNKKEKKDIVILDYFSGEANKMKLVNQSLVSAGQDSVFDTEDDIILDLLY